MVIALVRNRKHSDSGEGESPRFQESAEAKNANVPPARVEKKEEEEEDRELNEKTNKIERIKDAHKSGNLVFCSGEAELCSIEQLMRASAELLGRGNVGTTYKAVVDGRLIMTVKRLDAGKTAITSSEEFEKHMEMLGVLRHPNLVPVRAYFQAKGERLVIYDYQPNGSLFNLVHG